MDDPWNLPSSSTSDEDTIPTRVEMLLSTTKTAYQPILDPTVDSGPSSSWMKEDDIFALPAWAVASSCSHDFLNGNFSFLRYFSLTGIE